MIERIKVMVLKLSERWLSWLRKLKTTKVSLSVFISVVFLMILSFVIGVTYYLNDLDRLEVITTMYKPQSNDMKISGEMTVKYMKKLLRINKYNIFESFPLSSKYLDEIKINSLPMKLQTFGDFYATKSVCNDLKAEKDIYVSNEKHVTFDLLVFLRKLHSIQSYSELIKLAQKHFDPFLEEKTWNDLDSTSDSKILSGNGEEKKWLRFGGSSVWLPEYNIHYMVSRVLYSPSEIPNQSFASFLYIQIFDSNWNELPDGTTLEFPFEEVVPIDTSRIQGLFHGTRIERFLNFKKTSFPYVLPIPFDYELEPYSNRYYFGPEDPRVSIRRNSLGFIEPIIVFNMKTFNLTKRVMHLYLPFSDDLKILKKRKMKFAHIEKNWIPLMGNLSESQNTMKFVYSFEPLEVLECSIYSGFCSILQKSEKEDYNYFGDLRGGTQLIQLPIFSSQLIPDSLSSIFTLPENRKVYVGWARTHLNDCGCGDSMYRPNFILLIEDYTIVDKKYSYRISDISGYFDFNAEIVPWYPDETKGIVPGISGECLGRNVLTPNSIAYWEIESVTQNDKKYTKQDLKYNKFEGNRNSFQFVDRMGVTLSSGDRDVRIVHVKGLLDYILKLPSLFNTNVTSTLVDNVNLTNVQCAKLESEKYCRIYAIDHDAVIL